MTTTYEKSQDEARADLLIGLIVRLQYLRRSLLADKLHPCYVSREDAAKQLGEEIKRAEALFRPGFFEMPEARI
jgi:hypothetical protein